MMLPETLSEAVSRMITRISGNDGGINGISPVSGGSINGACKLDCPSGRFFLKYNDACRYPAMFEKEAAGLSLLGNTNTIRVPGIIGHGQAGKHAFLLLEYVDNSPAASDYWEDFGRRLAALHKNTASLFGLDHDNYIGSLPQQNGRYDRWVDFFREERLKVQLDLAIRNGLMPAGMQKAFERLFGKLDDIFPEEPPSLVHGDLWSGNYMPDENGHVCIIDPAVYYGSREMDLAMTMLFGMAGSGFYEACHEAFPLQPGWRERIKICNLYPLLVHVNLFGKGYLGSVEGILKEF
jgi:protein-ribulosamine 3-kinase